MSGWLRRNPLPPVLAAQAAVYFTHLGLLSPWMDEVATLTVVRRPLAHVIRIAASDVHPPLYYLLVWCFERVPLHLDWAVQARVVSVLLALAATVALDRLWARRLPERRRIAVLALWAASPCLLLYARMCRSYSLQVLVGILAAAAIARAAEPARRVGRPLGPVLIAALALGLYTHYALGLALAATANLVLLRERRWRAALFVDAGVAVLYLPWVYFLASSLRKWGQTPEPAQLALKLAYWGVSFTMGEAVPDAVLIAGLAVLPLVAAMMLAGAARDRELLWIAAPLTAVGFIGVARWVSYPFVPARMLFVLPFFLLLVVEGASRYRRAGAAAVVALLALSLSGIWCYFHEIGFRNKQYPMPMTQIAAQIRAAGEAGILVDGANSDPPALAYALGGSRAVLSTTNPAAEKSVAALLADPRVRTFWFLRNMHDVSAGGLNARFEQQLGAAMAATRFEYEPFTGLETRLMRAMGMTEPPRYFHELVEYRR